MKMVQTNQECEGWLGDPASLAKLLGIRAYNCGQRVT
jgi:hypothetical protein